MHLELQLALQHAVTPERLEQILAAHRLLVDVGQTAMDDELLQVLGLDDADQTLLVSRVTDVLYAGLRQCLQEFEIEMSDTAPLGLMTDVLTTVANLEYYLIPETLLDIANDDSWPEEVIARLVPLLTGSQTDEVLEHLLTVSPTCIARIRQIAEDHLGLREVQVRRPEQHERRIRLLNRLTTLTQGANPQIVKRLAKNGVNSGLSPDILLELALPMLDELEPDQLPGELLGLVYFSNTPLDRVEIVTSDLIGDYCDDQLNPIPLQRRARALQQQLEYPA